MGVLPSRRENVVRTLSRVVGWMVVVLVSAEFLLAAYGKYGLLDSPAYGRFVDRHGHRSNRWMRHLLTTWSLSWGFHVRTCPAVCRCRHREFPGGT